MGKNAHKTQNELKYKRKSLSSSLQMFSVPKVNTLLELLVTNSPSLHPVPDSQSTT